MRQTGQKGWIKSLSVKPSGYSSHTLGIHLSEKKTHLYVDIFEKIEYNIKEGEKEVK